VLSKMLSRAFKVKLVSLVIITCSAFRHKLFSSMFHGNVFERYFRENSGLFQVLFFVEIPHLWRIYCCNGSMGFLQRALLKIMTSKTITS
jgi:hypothetical protein